MPDGSKVENWDVPGALDMDRFLHDLRSLKTSESESRSLTQIAGVSTFGGFDVTGAVPLDPSNLESSVVQALSPYLYSLKERFRSMLNPLGGGADSPGDPSQGAFRKSLNIVLVDGFLLFADLAVAQEFDFRVFLDADYATLKQRRESRSGYLTSDGSIWKDPPGFFDSIVWLAAIENNSLIRDPVSRQEAAIDEDTLILDTGSSDLESCVERVAGLLLESLSRRVGKI
ncbi:hypothetical protein M427DRAFT_50452 [Gonapodya prolifera JEL478]|uniref:P-loop containing nucleoside triphosphate hydrolase protein n=1 Tax=Gonapodya prolifera (strain JEL478) TaxID=1344416 RepID=A0A139AZF8_GONPJ|nr:hypothetical protein M427DRAFT_50452 [Gonapodya prolifera JEL478]|eukprot:KXS22090.1 hypothetical protein M427DRAFT_50452 [Gonapodya prolifera JEL478]